MLKKNFLEPDDEFTPIPFWFWNDFLDKAEIKRQITDFYDKGVMGFVIHPRIGIPKDIEYLSDRFMDYVEYAVELAANLGMQVILYDEGMYPSGSAHGMVVDGNPEYASKGLKMIEYPYNKGQNINVDLCDGESIVSVLAMCKKGNNSVEIITEEIDCTGGVITFEPSHQADWSILAFIETYSEGTIRGIHFGEDDGEPGAPASTDLLNEKAIKKFISLTHERYYEVLKQYFGNTIIAMFTDEPGILGRNSLEGLIPWTDGFLEYFINSGNEERDLPALFIDMGELSETIERNYKKAINKKLEISYYMPLSKWCEEHGIQLTGHPEESDEIGLLKHFQIPGQDVVWRWVSPEDGKAIQGEHSTMGKCSSDAARHYGRRRNSNECFGCCGSNGIHWSFSADDMKWYLDWLFVRGVNLIYPHAFFYSVDGEGRYGERPPDVGPNNIWWKYYKNVSDYIKRMSYILTDSVNQARIAVLCQEDHLPWEIVKPLYENQIEFNYLEVNLLTSAQCEINDGSILIEKQKYSILLIEDEGLYTAEAKGKINSFLESGGRVIVFNQSHPLNYKNMKNITQYEQVVEHLRDKDVGNILIKPSNAYLRVSHVVKEGIDFYLLINEGEKAIEGELHINTVGKVERWDAWKGTVEELEVQLPSHGVMVANICIERRESLILSVDQQKEPLEQKYQTLKGKSVLTTSGFDNWSVTRQGCKPYLTHKLKSWHEWEEFTGYQGEIIYETTFEINHANDVERVELDLGSVYEIAHVYINDKDMGYKLWDPYVFDITNAVIQGENLLKIVVTNSKANKYEKKNFTSGLVGPVSINGLKHIAK